MPRLFIGTYLDKEAQVSLGALPLLNDHLPQSWNTRLKWVKESKLHLTWLFLGDVESEKLSQALKNLVDEWRGGETNLHQTELTYDCLEVWYGQGAPRNLVLTPKEAPSHLLDFVKALRNQLVIFASEDVRQQAILSWKPHITLIRLPDTKDTTKLPLTHDLSSSHEHRNLKGKELPPTAINGLAELLPLHHSVKTVSLIESKEEDGTHHYDALQTYSLI
jgi:2'-5' RNA ligase